MEGTGEHYVKRCKADSERQRLYVFSHMWGIDPNTNTNLTIYTYTEHVSNSGTVIGDEGRRERRE
jgi:hypothetical protein